MTDIPNDPRIVGVVSSDPAFIMGSNSDLRNGRNVPVALVGRVPVKVSLENGAISVGDPLTSSTRKGYAAKSINSGRIIGYALEDYKDRSRNEKILVLVDARWYQQSPQQVEQVLQQQNSSIRKTDGGGVVITLG